jgi:membrane associated rhomboid family serine protease
MQLFIHAGLPMIGFSMLAAWVLKNSIEGKNKEFETSRGQASK